MLSANWGGSYTWSVADGDLYSWRKGTPRKLSQGDFASLMWEAVAAMRSQAYFEQALDEHGSHDGFVTQPRLRDVDFLRALKENDIYAAVSGPRRGPPVSCILSADVLFDTLEYLHREVVAKKYGEGAFNRGDGQEVFRATINPDLELFDPPMEMLPNGEIVERAPDALRPLIAEPVPSAPTPLRDPLEGAIEQYLRRDATPHDKRSALKHLADVLEPLREDIDEHLLPADEKALFHLANKFHIRHNDRMQQRRYDGDVWLDWMFYVYVATARALLSVIDRQELSERVLGQAPDDNGGLPF